MRLAPLLALLLYPACIPKNTHIISEPEWRTEAGKERVRIQLIASLIHNGNPREALVLIATARQRGDNDPKLDLHQAIALYQTGLPSEAERLLRSYLDHHPRDAHGWRELGLLQADALRAEEAVTSLTRSADLDDSHAATWNNLGFVLLSLQRYEPAVEAIRRAIALDGTIVRYRNNLGFALAGVGSSGDALQAFMSVALPADAHANMGLAFEMGGDDSSASEQYIIALEYNPLHEASREALARLTPSTEPSP